MRRMVWTCDRCNTHVEVPEEIVIVEDFSPAAFRRPPAQWEHLPGWEQFTDDESVSDVCPGCITAGERADRLFREAEADVIFGPGEEA